MDTKTKADSYQVGGDHYKQKGNFEEHWTRVHRLGQDYFQGCITKYVERWKKKGGIQDLKKARHFLDKYIELEESKILEEPMEPGYIKPKETMTELWQRGNDQLVKKEIDVTKIKSSDKHIEYEIGINPYPERLVDNFQLGEVMSTGWAQFVFEGAQFEGYLYTCRECGKHFNAPPHVNPHLFHECHAVATMNGPIVKSEKYTDVFGRAIPINTGPDHEPTFLPPELASKVYLGEPDSQGYVNQNGKS